MSVVNKLQRV